MKLQSFVTSIDVASYLIARHFKIQVKEILFVAPGRRDCHSSGSEIIIAFQTCKKCDGMLL